MSKNTEGKASFCRPQKVPRCVYYNCCRVLAIEQDLSLVNVHIFKICLYSYIFSNIFGLETRFHRSTPLGIEPGSPMTGCKQVDHWTSGAVYECSEIAGSTQGSPRQPTMSDVKLEGGPAASVIAGQKSCVRSSGIITLSV